MGVFSKVHRFREAGEEANIVNVERFGPPVKSLFTSSKVFSLHHRIEVTDDHENVRYNAETQFPSIHDKTDIYDSNGRYVAHIERKFFSLHERHYITMENGLSFELSNELFHLIKDITNVEGLGWQLQGNILGLNFEIYDESGRIIALISQKMFSLHDNRYIPGAARRDTGGNTHCFAAHDKRQSGRFFIRRFFVIVVIKLIINTPDSAL